MATEIKPAKKPAPTLYFIAAIKLIKGVAFLLLALGVFTLANKDLSDVFDQFLRWVHLDPERTFFARIGDWLDTITPANIRRLIPVRNGSVDVAEAADALYLKEIMDGPFAARFRKRSPPSPTAGSTPPSPSSGSSSPTPSTPSSPESSAAGIESEVPVP